MIGAAGRTRTGLGRRWRPRGRVAAPAALLLGALALIAVTNPLGGGRGSRGATANRAATSLATVTQRSLSSQTQVDGRLGYAGSSSVVVPAGTALSDLRQARQSVASDQAALTAAYATLVDDRQAAAGARAKVAADRQSLASDCAGANAAASGSGNGPNGDGSSPGSGSSPCATAAQTLTTDEQAATIADQKVTADRGTVGSAQATLSGAREALAAAESSAVAYDTGATYTMLPAAGTVVRRGRPLYAISGQPVLLLYGRESAWRTFRPGMTPGRDVAQLNENLRALGYGNRLSGDSVSAATERAITALQAAHGLTPTGELRVGSVVFKPGPVRVKSVTPARGAAVQAGPVLTVTSTGHQVTIELDAARQSEVKAGDKVTITLPDTRTTPGVVSSVGSVASTAKAGETPKINVHVRLADEAAAGHLDQAPVTVSITTATVKHALVVPVNALLALAGGGYAVEEVGPGGVHRLVPVNLALVDDAAGLVQLTGSGLHAGQRIVVPAS